MLFLLLTSRSPLTTVFNVNNVVYLISRRQFSFYDYRFLHILYKNITFSLVVLFDILVKIFRDTLYPTSGL